MQVEEVGPHTDREGPCTLLLTGVTTPPEQFNAWLLRSPVFAALVVRLYQLGPSASGAAHMAETREAVLEQIAAAGPPPAPVRLQCSPRSLEVWLGERLPPAWQLAVTGFGHVLNMVRLGERAWRHWTHPAALLYQYPPAGPQRVPSQLSKAAGKLTEALAAAAYQPSPGSVAIDVGAAPGGWTAVLAAQVALVIAIDPAEMDPRALLPNVRHLRCRVEAAEERVRALAAGHPLDLLCCDANMHAAEVLGLVRPLLPLLRQGGLLVLTLKFCGRGRDKGRYREEVAAGLEAAAPGCSWRVELQWLLANTINERCVLAHKGGGAGGSAPCV